MIEKIAQDILNRANIKLAGLSELFEKIAAGNITNAAQLMQHIGTQPMAMLNNLRNSIQSGHFNGNLEPLKKFHSLFQKNPALQQAGNRNGFTSFFNNFMSQATQAAKPNTGNIAQAMNNQRIQQAVQRSRIQAGTNGIPYFGSYVK